jgi:Asp-tRNA(Asn)/Glu-tRNA(Gln) amidotransferase A subunit family amidase
MQEMDTLFRRVDVLLAPMATEPMTVIGNMTGHPCLTIRAASPT